MFSGLLPDERHPESIAPDTNLSIVCDFVPE